MTIFSLNHAKKIHESIKLGIKIETAGCGIPTSLGICMELIGIHHSKLPDFVLYHPEVRRRRYKSEPILPDNFSTLACAAEQKRYAQRECIEYF